jgi:hypothetical protein
MAEAQRREMGGHAKIEISVRSLENSGNSETRGRVKMDADHRSIICRHKSMSIAKCCSYLRKLLRPGIGQFRTTPASGTNVGGMTPGRVKTQHKVMSSG